VASNGNECDFEIDDCPSIFPFKWMVRSDLAPTDARVARSLVTRSKNPRVQTLVIMGSTVETRMAQAGKQDPNSRALITWPTIPLPHYLSLCIIELSICPVLYALPVLVHIRKTTGNCLQHGVSIFSLM